MSTSLRTVLSYALALVVGLAIGAYASRRYDTRDSVPVAIARERTRVAERVVMRADTLWRTDTLRLTRTLTRYDTARVRDTVVRDSVVYVRAGVADSAVQACRLVVRSCAANLAARDSVIVSQRAEIRAVLADRPSLLRRVAGRAAWLGAGYVLGRAGVGRGISLSVPTPF